MSDWSPRGYLLRGLIVMGLGFGGIAVWSGLTEVSGAVVASGQVGVEARQQAIQHRTGGLITALHVREGDGIAAGDAILTLDDTELQAQRALTRRELLESVARLDRLSSELRQAQEVTFRDGLEELFGDLPGFLQVLNDEAALFAARRLTLTQTNAQLLERQTQTEAIIRGRTTQLEAARRRLDLLQSDLGTQENLLERGLTDARRVSELRRGVAQLEGEIGELEAGIAEARSGIAGFEVERLTQEAAFLEAAQAELRDIQPGAAELRERLRVIETDIARLVLRAPMSGRIFDLRANTVGGVAPAGTELAYVVPDDVPLTLTVEVDPSEIDRVFVGQSATITFPNFDTNLTPELDGQVSRVSADALVDEATSRRYYTAELTLNDGFDAIIDGQELRPGMPVSAFLQTDARTPASFLLKPIRDYWQYAMREE